ncbi:unnamed protein product [Dicrocoelium dendriticum]|nr:unnamed protein product [Dicrocoelium dendriticum]
MHKLLCFALIVCHFFYAGSLQAQSRGRNVFRLRGLTSENKEKIDSLKDINRLTNKIIATTESPKSNTGQQGGDEIQHSPLRYILISLDHYEEWSNWSQCVIPSCIQYRYRRCTDDSWKQIHLSKSGKYNCPSTISVETRRCIDQTGCPVPGTFPNCGIRPQHLSIEPKIVGGENSLPNAWPWLDVWCIHQKHNKPFSTEAEVNVACLPVDYTAPDHGTECYAVGWGELQSSVDTSFFDAFWSLLGNSTKAGFKYPMPQTQDNKMVSDQLREVRLTVLDAKECSNYYTDLDEKRILCAGSNGKGACFGDSGGGLYCRSPSSKAWFVAGVTSFGHSSRCGLIPGGFTSVNAHRGWIWRTIAHSTSEMKVKPEQLIFERKLMERIKDEAGVSGLLDNTAVFERKLTERIKDVTELLDNTAGAANDQFTTTEMELGQSNVTGSTRRSGSTFILIACSAICAVYFEVAG